MYAKLVRLFIFHIDFLITSIPYATIVFLRIAALTLDPFMSIVEKSMLAMPFIPEVVYEWMFFIFYIGPFFILFILYSAIFTSKFGATIGKMIFGLKVVDQDYNPISYKLAAKRTILLLVFGWFWIFLASKESPHDKLLNLHVVKRSNTA